MAAIKAAAVPHYRVDDAHNKGLLVRPGTVAKTIEFVSGGDKVVLSQQNFIDLWTSLSNFEATGTWA